MRLNIYTHEHPGCRSKVKRTYESFLKTFGEAPLTIFCDNPSDKYLKWLRESFKAQIVATKGLADGYIKSLEAEESYLFQLEGDWEFNKNINHSLKEIIELMEKDGIYHFRFNKSKNILKITKYQSSFKEKKGKISYCETDCMSNNPHIINRRLYIKKCLPSLDGNARASFGIEEKLNRKSFISCVYGKRNYEPTVSHIGRGTSLKEKLNK